MKKGIGWLKIILIAFVLIVLVLIAFTLLIYFSGRSGRYQLPSQHDPVEIRRVSVNTSSGTISVPVTNPMSDIVQDINNEDNSVVVTREEVVQQGITDFNAEYINYLLNALGVGRLHSAPIYGNPVVEMNVDGEIWNAEIVKNTLSTKTGDIGNEDIRIIMTREEAVNALLNPDPVQYMRNSVVGGRTNIEKVASDVELFAKGYLDMYNALK